MNCGDDTGHCQFCGNQSEAICDGWRRDIEQRAAAKARAETLREVAILCDCIGQNRYKDDPRAAYQAGAAMCAAKCAWEIRRLAKATGEHLPEKET